MNSLVPKQIISLQIYDRLSSTNVTWSIIDKAKLFDKKFSKNSNLDDSGISLPVFLSKTNVKLYNISVTLNMIKKIIMRLDSSKPSGPDCISEVVLKNCEPEFLYILAELYNMKVSCFPDC